MIRAGLVFAVLCCGAYGQSSTAAPDQKADKAEQGQQTATPDSTSLEPLHVVRPAYPLEGQKNKLQGGVTIKALVSESGDVASTDAISGDPLLAQAAIAAVKEWKFKPFIKNQKPAKVSTKLQFRFIFVESSDTHELNAATTDVAAGDASVGIPIVFLAPNPRSNRVLKKTNPEYPPIARTARVQGNVVLFVAIGTDGAVGQAGLVSGHPLLSQSAIDAVKQWRYKPFLLDGKPVETQTLVTVNYSLR